MAKNKLGQWGFLDGYASSVPRIVLQSIMAWGSQNALVTGLGFARNFGGLDKFTGAGSKGSTQFFQTDNTFAGLGDETTRGKGSILKVKSVLAFTGEGPIRIAGEDLGIDADSTLQYVVKDAGEWITPAYPVSQARPSSPTIYPTSTPGTGHTAMDGAVVVVIWRIDSITGQVSLASLASNVLNLSAQSVIVPFPAVDTAQDYWGIGVCRVGYGLAPVMFELKTDLGGEVAESTLAYTRNVTQASIGIGDRTLTLDGSTPLGDRFTGADQGRRVSIPGKLDSWIASVTDAFNAEVNDDATATATNEALTITHAVEGIERAVEISWTTESLEGQELAPNDAYPAPSNLKHAGLINDTMFAETDDGIIYVGVPGFIGSYPPKNTLFPPEPAVLYLDGSDGLYWRWSHNMLQVLAYVGGTHPIELQTVWKNVGILFPQNAAIGIGGRAIAWSGKPVRLGAGGEPDVEFAYKVYKDFEGWNEQTEERPIVVQADPENQLDVWAYGQKVMACRAGTDIWCAPLDLSAYLAEDEVVIAGVIVDNRLRLSTNAGTDLFLYAFDEGEGGTMTIQTPEFQSPGESDTITQVEAVVHVDDTDSVSISVIHNFDDDDAELLETFTPDVSRENQMMQTRANIRNAQQHAIKIDIVSAGKQAGVQIVRSYGETNGIYTA